MCKIKKFDCNAWNDNRPGTKPAPGTPDGPRGPKGPQGSQVVGRPAPGTAPKPGTPGGPRAPKGLECGCKLAYGNKLPFDYNAWNANRPR